MTKDKIYLLPVLSCTILHTDIKEFLSTDAALHIFIGTLQIPVPDQGECY